MVALHDWQNFYLLTGTAAATLIGLLFVAASISMGTNLSLQQATNSFPEISWGILAALREGAR